MSRPPAARDAVLDAFERLIIRDGERAATLEATAREAGVSKGGLLYHFASRDALIGGLAERLRLLVDDDVERIATAPEGAISYFVRSSIALETPLDRAFVATVRLAQGGNRDAARAIDEVRDRWLEEIGRHTGDPTLALAIALIGDGLYYHSALRNDDEPSAGDPVDPAAMDSLVALLERLASEKP
ncbi:TetR family transcriptional regulator [Agromyces badenianii]|uniref:TetR family transcriptional regulator n=1 Tax=Agromyces badenianii TaxID=2080742 RepID=A0A2S0WWY7_9MICO|nr:TetR/AcrR family transcriptional regulator [Agromyces badenianii]AWB95821.1 TetR family transcriptional regulator [Agromyces badenianii]